MLSYVSHQIFSLDIRFYLSLSSTTHISYSNDSPPFSIKFTPPWSRNADDRIWRHDFGCQRAGCNAAGVFFDQTLHDDLFEADHRKITMDGEPKPMMELRWTMAVRRKRGRNREAKPDFG